MEQTSSSIFLKMLHQDSSPTYVIKTDDYISELAQRSPHLVAMKRVHHYHKMGYRIDAFGPLCITGFSDLPENLLSIAHSGQELPLSGRYGFHAPPFSLIQWRVNPGTITWEATASQVDKPDFIGNRAFLFDWDGTMPANEKELHILLTHAKNKVFIDEPLKPSALAKMVKEHIDKNFSETISISSIADKTQHSWAHMTRDFKKSYHISPLEYLHRVRLFCAVKLLSLGKPVTDCCFESGFNSVTQFNLHFKKYLGTQPSHYRTSYE